MPNIHISLSTFLYKASIWLGIVALFCMLSFKYIDLPVLLWVQENIDSSLFIIQFISDIGLGIWWFIIALVGIIVGHVIVKRSPNKEECVNGEKIKKYFLFMLNALIFGGIFVQLLKSIIGRPRPRLYLEEQLYQPEPFSFFISGMNSFPSGHAQLIWVVAFVLGYIYPRIRGISIFVAILVSLSRVALSAHYLADIVAGMYLGWLNATLVYYFCLGKTKKLESK